MKKRVFVLLLMLIFILTGCKSEPTITYNSFLLTSPECDWWIGGYQERQNAEMQKETVYEEVVYRGSYKDSYVAAGTHFMLDRYADKEKEAILYYKSASGQFSGIHFNNLISDEYIQREDILDEAGALELASKIALQYISIDEYHIEKEESLYPNDGQAENHTVKFYSFSFYRNIEGFYTSDKVQITFTSKGDLFSLRIADIGLFSEKLIPKIDNVALTKSIKKKLSDLYSKEYTYSYNIVKQTLTLSMDDHIVIVSQIELQLDGHHNTGLVLATDIE